MMKITSYELKKTNPKTGAHTFYMVEFRDPATGKPTRRRGFLGKREAKNKIMQLLVERQKSDFTGNPDITFNEVATRWLANKRRSGIAGSTYRKYESDNRNHLQGAFGNKAMKDINLEDCQNLVYCLADKYRRWDKKVGTFSSVFDYAIKYDIINRNPFNRVDRPKVEEKSQPALTPEELRIFNQGLKDCYRNSNPKAFTFLWLLSHLGLRKGEAMGLRWSDIDLVNGIVNIKVAATRDFDNRLIIGDRPKNQQSIRAVPIEEETITVLKEWRKCQRDQLKVYNVDTSKPSQLVFTNQHGGVLSNSKANKWIKTITKKYGLPDISPHGLRRTYGTVLATNGEPNTKVARLMGHKNTITTNKYYIKTLDDTDHSSAEIMERY